MVRKLALTLATAATVGAAAFIPTVASAGGYGYGPGEEVRSDFPDIDRDHAILRRDYEALGREVAHGRYGAARRVEDEIDRDRRELHRDYRELGHDLYRRGY
jgi:hypothetical protein